MARSERTARSVLALSAPRAGVERVALAAPGARRRRAVQGLHKHRNVSESMERGPEFDSR